MALVKESDNHAVKVEQHEWLLANVNLNPIQMKSRKYELNKEDWKRILRTIVVIYSPVLFMFLDQIQAGKFDWKILVALGISVTVDTLRRLLTDYTK